MTELARFPTALIADCLDDLGHHAQVLPPAMQLVVSPATGVLAGRIRTLTFRPLPPEKRHAPVDRVAAAAALSWRDAWGLERGDVVVINVEGGVPDVCLQGDLVALYYARIGVAGVVADGYVRDLVELGKTGLGIVARGTTPQNGRGRLGRVGTGATLDIGGVSVAEGDTFIADGDGCVVVPRALVDSGELLRACETAQREEEETAQMVRAGHSLSDAFARYGRL